MNPLAGLGRGQLLRLLLSLSDSEPVHSCKARLQTQLRVDYAGILSGRSIVRHAYVPVGTCVAQQMPDAAR